MEYYQDLMVNKRKNMFLDTYFETVLNQLRGRLKFAIEIQIDSLKKVDGKKLPVPITRKFGDFISSILFVRSQLNSAEDPQLSHQIDSLISVYETLMVTVGKRYGANQSEQVIWHLNNLDIITSIFKERGLSAENISSVKKFSDKLNMYISVFVEAKLSEHFGPLIKVTLDMEKSSSTSSDLERQAVWFQQNWKSEIRKIKNEIVDENIFPNLKTANEIFKSVLAQLMLYYTRFQKFVPPRHIVPNAVIMSEIKQISSA